MWNPSKSGIKPVPPALVCKFFTEPPEKPLFLLLFLLHWETDLGRHWYNLCQRVFCLCSLLGVLRYSVLYFSSSHFELIFVYDTRYSTFIYVQLSSVPQPLAEEAVFFPLCVLISFVKSRYVDLFLGCLFCTIDPTYGVIFGWKLDIVDNTFVTLDSVMFCEDCFLLLLFLQLAVNLFISNYTVFFLYCDLHLCCVLLVYSYCFINLVPYRSPLYLYLDVTKNFGRVDTKIMGLNFFVSFFPSKFPS